MATINTAELTNLFEKVIDPMLRTLHVDGNKSPLPRLWKEGRNGGEGTKTMDGETFFVTVTHSLHSNVQTQPEGATLLRGRSRNAQPSFKTMSMSPSFTFSYKALKTSDSRAGALISVLMNETQAMLKRAQNMFAFYANNDGQGIVCLVNDGSPNSKSTVAVDNVRATSIEHLLNVGDSLGISSAAERTLGTGQAVTVASIDSTTQITVDETTSGLADNDEVHFSEAYDTVNSAETSKIGVDGLLATSGTVQTITLSTALYYNTQEETTGETVSTTRILEYLQLADARVDDSTAFIITLGDLWWKLVDLMVGTPQGDPHRVQEILHGGARGLRFSWFGGDTPVFFDPYCRIGYVFGLDLNNLGYKQLYPLHLIEDGSALAHRITQKLDYEVVATEDGNFYVIDPRANFKLTGKTTT